MLSNNQFLIFETIDSYEDAKAFIKDKGKLYASTPDYESQMEKILSYKKNNLKDYKPRKDGKSAYRNIYAYHLCIMIPFEIEENQYEEFVKQYMLMISKQYKKLLYIYYFNTKGRGTYVHIMCFTRYVYDKPINKKKKWNRDYYYNKQTNKLCRKNDPDAVLKHRKGEVVNDDDGKAIKEKRTVEYVEKKIFKYTSFKKFVQKLKNKVVQVTNELCSNWLSRMVISRITVNLDDSKTIRMSLYRKNLYINTINDILVNLQKQLLRKYTEESNEYFKFINFIETLDEIVHNQSLKIEEIKKIISEWWTNNISNINPVIE
ncbi:MAG: hypothetical protein LUG60_02455 [Erysipelotrichaceae bacterium]|nr:hypothetical protein [Erysipelotrichaceae bacterium]